MLKLREVEECLYPQSIQEATIMLQERGDKARIVGGGLHLAVFPNPSIKTLIFLNKLNLNYVKETDSKIIIGAETTISSLAESSVMKKYLKGYVKNILDHIASQLLRNQITIGGSIAQREPYSDITTILMALNANVVFTDGKNDSKVNINSFYKSNFREMLRGIIIREVELEKFDQTHKFGMERFVRNATDIPLLNFAILSKIENNIIKESTVIIGSRPGPAEKFVKAEEYLKEKPLKDTIVKEFKTFVSQNADVEGDVRVSKEYRSNIAGVFGQNILQRFMEA
jgi:carbon-monoxide dehydrogenase medium subunit